MAKKKILYSAVVLDEKSHTELVDYFGRFFPDDWTVYAHHMTINMGALPENLKPFLGTTVELKVTDIGIDKLALAIGVSGFESANEHPHVTLAVNTLGGGTPKDSNGINIWNPIISIVMTLSGVVTEVTN